MKYILMLPIIIPFLIVSLIVMLFIPVSNEVRYR